MWVGRAGAQPSPLPALATFLVVMDHPFSFHAPSAFSMQLLTQLLPPKFTHIPMEHYELGEGVGVCLCKTCTQGCATCGHAGSLWTVCLIGNILLHICGPGTGLPGVLSVPPLWPLRIHMPEEQREVHPGGLPVSPWSSRYHKLASHTA